MHFDCAGSQDSRCGAVRISDLDGLGNHCSQQAREPHALLAQSRLFVAGAALWTWWWSSACSDFVAGAVNPDLFRSRRQSRAKATGWHFDAEAPW